MNAFLQLSRPNVMYCLQGSSPRTSCLSYYTHQIPNRGAPASIERASLSDVEIIVESSPIIKICAAMIHVYVRLSVFSYFSR